MRKVISMKPTVRYSASAYKIRVGKSALIEPIDHPSGLVSNDRPARTSTVLSVDDATGNFETKNTVYIYNPLGNVETADGYEVEEIGDE